MSSLQFFYYAKHYGHRGNVTITWPKNEKNKEQAGINIFQNTPRPGGKYEKNGHGKKEKRKGDGRERKRGGDVKEGRNRRTEETEEPKKGGRDKERNQKKSRIIENLSEKWAFGRLFAKIFIINNQ